MTDRTFYTPVGGGLVYFAPSGTTYQAETTTVVEGQWKVDETGQFVIRRLPFAGTLSPIPIEDFASTLSVAGDPAALSSNSDGFAVSARDDRSLEEIIAQAAAR